MTQMQRIEECLNSVLENMEETKEKIDEFSTTVHVRHARIKHLLDVHQALILLEAAVKEAKNMVDVL